jgi:hypothetical protein
MRRALRFAAGGALLAAAACALAPPGVSRSAGGMLAWDHPALHVTDAELDARVTARKTARAADGTDLLRVDFSFVAYQGYVAEDDRHVSTGTIFFPLDDGGHPVGDDSHLLLVTEYPPGASRAGFDFLAEYGERPAAELGVPSAVVDVRGPVVSGLRFFVNPDDPGGGMFSGEAQFAYAMLRSYEESGDPQLLWEYQAAGAWLRALAALERLSAQELGSGDIRVLAVGEGWGALSAAQAGALDPEVAGVVAAGWPLDWMDYHFVRWRRWERRSGYDPLESLSPIAWSDSREVLSFLASTPQAPDPGCPACVGSGSAWRSRFDLHALRSSRRLDAALFLLESDEDPDLPIDLLARACAPSDELHALPGNPPPGGGPAFQGPFATARALPYDDLRVLRGGRSTIARSDAAEAVRAWTQHLAGFRDLPRFTAEEEVRDGDLVVTAVVAEGNARVTDVLMRVIETSPSEPWDFKSSLHRTKPEPLAWHNVPVIYSGSDARFRGRWTARFPLLSGVNQAYTLAVRTRIGDAATEHSLPIRPLWNRGDPAEGPASP